MADLSVTSHAPVDISAGDLVPPPLLTYRDYAMMKVKGETVPPGRRDVLALIANPQGCKVGWAYYDVEAEAQARAAEENEARERKFKLGYDFGYQWPGSIQYHAAHPEYGECWSVVTT